MSNDFLVEISIIPIDMEFEPCPEKMICRSVTTATNLDEIFTQSDKLLKKLPDSNNDTGWG